MSDYQNSNYLNEQQEETVEETLRTIRSVFSSSSLSQIQTDSENSQQPIQSLINRANALREEIRLLPEDCIQNVEPIEGDLYDDWSHGNKMKTYTQFTKHQLDLLLQDMQPYIAKHTKRGKKPLLSITDSFLVLLLWFRTGSPLEKLACELRMTQTRVTNAIDRVAPIILDCLEDKYWKQKKRPTARTDNRFFFTGLAVDCTTTPINKPTGTFNESKPFWDQKNKCYGLKFQVCCTVQSPHLAMFVEDYCKGAVNDYTIFRETFEKYKGYLRKTPQELVDANMITDCEDLNWAIVGDKAYGGPVEDTIGLRRLFPKKHNQTLYDPVENREISKVRVGVEMFFGRLKMIFPLFLQNYKCSHEKIDVLFKVATLLTNYHLEINNPVQMDYEYNQQCIAMLVRRAAMAEQSKIASRVRHRARNVRLSR